MLVGRGIRSSGQFAQVERRPLWLQERFRQLEIAISTTPGHDPDFEKQYLYLLCHLLLHGEDRPNRTAIGCRSIFGAHLRLGLQKGFPLLTTKKVHFRSILWELLWFLRGDTNVAYLQERGVSIWDEWADQNGELGPIYGAQWRAWRGADGESIDQIALLEAGLKSDPFSRRHIVSAWNVAELNRMALAPCHCLAQFYVSSTGELSCQLYQRSVDIFLGLPFNIASYSLLTSLLAQVCRLKPGRLLLAAGDLHLYHNHFEQAILQLERDPFPLPLLRLDPAIDSMDAFCAPDAPGDPDSPDPNMAPAVVGHKAIILENYRSHPAIPAPIAV